jgi:hypothetical protein
MPAVYLVVCVAVAWAIAACVDSLPGLGSMLMPSPWLLGALALILITWVMGD